MEVSPEEYDALAKQSFYIPWNNQGHHSSLQKLMLDPRQGGLKKCRPLYISDDLKGRHFSLEYITNPCFLDSGFNHFHYIYTT